MKFFFSKTIKGSNCSNSMKCSSVWLRLLLLVVVVFETVYTFIGWFGVIFELSFWIRKCLYLKIYTNQTIGLSSCQHQTLQTNKINVRSYFDTKQAKQTNSVEDRLDLYAQCCKSSFCWYLLFTQMCFDISPNLNYIIKSTKIL